MNEEQEAPLDEVVIQRGDLKITVMKNNVVFHIDGTAFQLFDSTIELIYKNQQLLKSI